jgi:hypothetical protein
MALPPSPHAGKPPPFQAQGSPAVPLLAVAALAVLAAYNLHSLSSDGGGGLLAFSLLLLQQVAVPLALAAALLVLMLKRGSLLVDKPQLAPELAVPWH